MHRAAGVNRFESADDLDRDAGGNLRRNALHLLEHSAQVDAVHVLLRDVLIAAIGEAVVDRDHVLMVDLPCGVGLAPKALQELRTAGEVVAQLLQDGSPLEPVLPTEINDAHSPAADLLLDGVVPESLRAGSRH